MLYELNYKNSNTVLNVKWIGELSVDDTTLYIMKDSLAGQKADGVIHDFTGVENYQVTAPDILHISEMVKEFGPDLSGLKVAMLVSDETIKERVEIFTTLRKLGAGLSPDYRFYQHYEDAMSWIVGI